MTSWPSISEQANKRTSDTPGVRSTDGYIRLFLAHQHHCQKYQFEIIDDRKKSRACAKSRLKVWMRLKKYLILANIDGAGWNRITALLPSEKLKNLSIELKDEPFHT